MPISKVSPLMQAGAGALAPDNIVDRNPFTDVGLVWSTLGKINSIPVGTMESVRLGFTEETLLGAALGGFYMDYAILEAEKKYGFDENFKVYDYLKETVNDYPEMMQHFISGRVNDLPNKQALDIFAVLNQRDYLEKKRLEHAGFFGVLLGAIIGDMGVLRGVTLATGTTKAVKTIGAKIFAAPSLKARIGYSTAAGGAIGFANEWSLEKLNPDRNVEYGDRLIFGTTLGAAFGLVLAGGIPLLGAGAGAVADRWASKTARTLGKVLRHETVVRIKGQVEADRILMRSILANEVTLESVGPIWHVATTKKTQHLLDDIKTKILDEGIDDIEIKKPRGWEDVEVYDGLLDLIDHWELARGADPDSSGPAGQFAKFLRMALPSGKIFGKTPFHTVAEIIPAIFDDRMISKRMKLNSKAVQGNAEMKKLGIEAEAVSAKLEMATPLSKHFADGGSELTFAIDDAMPSMQNVTITGPRDLGMWGKVVHHYTARRHAVTMKMRDSTGYGDNIPKALTEASNLYEKWHRRVLAQSERAGNLKGRKALATKIKELRELRAKSKGEIADERIAIEASFHAEIQDSYSLMIDELYITHAGNVDDIVLDIIGGRWGYRVAMDNDASAAQLVAVSVLETKAEHLDKLRLGGHKTSSPDGFRLLQENLKNINLMTAKQYDDAARAGFGDINMAFTGDDLLDMADSLNMTLVMADDIGIAQGGKQLFGFQGGSPSQFGGHTAIVIRSPNPASGQLRLQPDELGIVFLHEVFHSSMRNNEQFAARMSMSVRGYMFGAEEEIVSSVNRVWATATANKKDAQILYRYITDGDNYNEAYELLYKSASRPKQIRPEVHRPVPGAVSVHNPKTFANHWLENIDSRRRFMKNRRSDIGPDDAPAPLQPKHVSLEDQPIPADVVSPFKNTLYHGTRSDPRLLINENGDLVLNPSKNFEGKTEGVSLSTSQLEADDYRGRITATPARTEAQGALILIDEDAIPKGRLSPETMTERATTGSEPLIIPRGKFKIALHHQARGRLREWKLRKMEDIAALSNEDLASQFAQAYGRRLDREAKRTPFHDIYPGNVPKDLEADIVARYGSAAEDDLIIRETAKRSKVDEEFSRLADDYFANAALDFPENVRVEVIGEGHRGETSEFLFEILSQENKMIAEKAKAKPFALDSDDVIFVKSSRKDRKLEAQDELLVWEHEAQQRAKSLSDQQLGEEFAKANTIAEIRENNLGGEFPEARPSEGLSSEIFAKYGDDPDSFFVSQEIIRRSENPESLAAIKKAADETPGQPYPSGIHGVDSLVKDGFRQEPLKPLPKAPSKSSQPKPPSERAKKRFEKLEMQKMEEIADLQEKMAFAEVYTNQKWNISTIKDDPDRFIAVVTQQLEENLGIDMTKMRKFEDVPLHFRIKQLASNEERIKLDMFDKFETEGQVLADKTLGPAYMRAKDKWITATAKAFQERVTTGDALGLDGMIGTRKTTTLRGGSPFEERMLRYTDADRFAEFLNSNAFDLIDNYTNQTAGRNSLGIALQNNKELIEPLLKRHLKPGDDFVKEADELFNGNPEQILQLFEAEADRAITLAGRTDDLLGSNLKAEMQKAKRDMVKYVKGKMTELTGGSPITTDDPINIGAWQAIGRTALRGVVLARQGGMMVSSLMDIASNSIGRHMPEGAPTATQLFLTRMSKWPKAMREGLAVNLNEMEHNRAMFLTELDRAPSGQLAGQTGFAGFAREADELSDKATRLFFKHTGMNWWNQKNKAIAAYVTTQDWMIRLRGMSKARRLMKKTTGMTEKEALRKVGLDEKEVAEMIKFGFDAKNTDDMLEQMYLHGTDYNGNRFADSGKTMDEWLDTYKGAMMPNYERWAKHQDKLYDIWTSGITSETLNKIVEPKLLSRPVSTQYFLGKAIHQFWSFSYAWANQQLVAVSYLPAGRQTQFYLHMISLGAISDALHNELQGRRTLAETGQLWMDKPAGMMYRAIDRSGLLSYISRVLSATDNTAIGIGKLTGADPTTRQTRPEDLPSLVAPIADWGMSLSHAVTPPLAGEMPSWFDWHKFRSSLPYQNLMAINFFNRITQKMGIPALFTEGEGLDLFITKPQIESMRGDELQPRP